MRKPVLKEKRYIFISLEIDVCILELFMEL